jgi:sodium-coupled neutral amino acid transporter 11
VFGTQGPWTFNSNLWVLVSMLSTSYIAHYNAPKFYSELQDTSMPRFNKVIAYSFLAAVTAFVIMMSLGYLTFGGATAGFVLNNYANSDALATLARVAIGSALLTGYPFTFCAMRDGIMDIGKFDENRRRALRRPLTIGLITGITALAIALKDVGFVVSLSGALFGSTLMFMVPSWMNIQNINKRAAATAATAATAGGAGALSSKNGSRLEIALNYFMIVTGAAMGALGILISVLRQLGRI